MTWSGVEKSRAVVQSFAWYHPSMFRIHIRIKTRSSVAESRPRSSRLMTFSVRQLSQSLWRENGSHAYVYLPWRRGSIVYLLQSRSQSPIGTSLERYELARRGHVASSILVQKDQSSNFSRAGLIGSAHSCETKTLTSGLEIWTEETSNRYSTNTAQYYGCWAAI